jgi:transcriptional pleiotropic repressor
VLTEGATGLFSYRDLGKILSEVINANVYILDVEGKVLGTGYINAEDTSTVVDDTGMEKINDSHVEGILKIDETKINITGKEVKEILGEDYHFSEKYHGIIPSICGGKRVGTLLVARYDDKFDEEDIALCEYGAAVVALEIQRNNSYKQEEQARKNSALEMALASLSYSETDATCKILEEFEEDDGIIVISKIAGKHNITNSVMVNTLRKLESAGIITCHSLGMKGTRIKINNPYLRQRVKDLAK